MFLQSQLNVIFINAFFIYSRNVDAIFIFGLQKIERKIFKLKKSVTKSN